MPKADSIEDILARLMPVAMSGEAEERIGETIDQLAEESGVTVPVRPVLAMWPWFGGAAAAAVAVIAAIAYTRQQPADGSHLVADGSGPSSPDTELVSVSRSDSLQSVVEEGWRDDVQGNTHKALRLHMVAEQHLLDKETGILMTVSEPREEVLLYPVNAF